MKHWPRARIGDLASVVTKGTTPSSLGLPLVSAGVQLLRAQNVNLGRLIRDVDPVFISQEAHQVLRRSSIEPGDVLITIAGTIGRACVVPSDAPALNCNQAVAIVRVNGAVDHNFLRHWLMSDDAQQQIESRQVTGTITNLSLAQISDLSVPLPTKSNQKRIAVILDAVETLRENRLKTIDMLDHFVEATFDELFDANDGPPVTVSLKKRSRWPRVLLTNVARLATGHTPDRTRPDYWNGDIPWITLSDIRLLDGTVAQGTQECVSQAGIENSSAVKLPAGTVCFSRTASVGFVTVMGREMCTSQDFVNWVCGHEIDPIYLMNALIRTRQSLRALSTGSTHKTIYFPTVEQFHVLAPPIELQLKFKLVWFAIQELRKKYDRQFEDAMLLNSSLQQRVFSSQL